MYSALFLLLFKDEGKTLTRRKMEQQKSLSSLKVEKGMKVFIFFI